MSRRVYVNEAFRPQRISGQQRYAQEISARLPADYVRVAPGRFWAANAVRTWLWTLLVLPLHTWRGVLVSMTARAPWYHPRHVVVVHDLFVIEHPEWFSRIYYWTHAPLLRLQLQTARALVAVSEPVAEQVRRLRPDLEVAVAPNAPSEVFTRAAGEDTEPLARHDLVPGSYFLVVGNLEPRKNLARLAAAYGLLTDAQRAAAPLVVVGGGASIYQSHEIEWPPGARLLGYVDDPDLACLYAHSRAVVFPSLAEGFGLPIVEAIAAGAAHLLLSDIPVFRWIASDSATYFSPTSTESVHATLASTLHGEGTTKPPRSSRTLTWDDSAAALADVTRQAG